MRTERQTALIDAYTAVADLRKTIERLPDRGPEVAILWSALDRLYSLFISTLGSDDEAGDPWPSN